MNKAYFLDINKLKKEFSYEEIYNLVSSYRKDKVDKLKFEKDKWLSLGVEFLLMQELNKLKIDYSKVELDFRQNNKPYLKNCNQKLFFNLSHSEKMAMCTIADNEVGCDIQKISINKDFITIADRFFHPREIQVIRNAKEKEQIDLFYRIWVLKESYIKATGEGFQTPLKDFQISLDNERPKVVVEGIIQNDFILEEKHVDNPNYKSAVCIKRAQGKNAQNNCLF